MPKLVLDQGKKINSVIHAMPAVQSSKAHFSVHMLKQLHIVLVCRA
jgi:hypothetical protein